MKILIIGFGYIVKNLLPELYAKNNIVTVFANRLPSEHERAIYHYVKFIHWNLEKNDGCINGSENYDVMIHAYSTTIPSTSNQNFEYDIKTNLLSSVSLFQCAAKAGVKKIIYISSGGAVYGNAGNSVKEESSQTDPVSSYGVVKIAVEKYLKIIALQYGVQAVSLRVTNPYGGTIPEGKDRGFVNTLISCVKGNRKFYLMGDGSAVKDFIHVSDVVRAISKSVSIEFTKSTELNVGYGKSYSLIDILEMARKSSGVKIDISSMHFESHDVKNSRISIECAKKILGWEPRISLDSYIETELSNLTN